MEKERYSVLDHETGDMIPVDKFLLERIQGQIIEGVMRRIEQNRVEVLQPNFLRGMIVKHPGENGGNGNKKRG